MWETQAENGPRGLDLTQRRPSPKPAAGFDDFVARLRPEKMVNSREPHVGKRREARREAGKRRTRTANEEREV